MTKMRSNTQQQPPRNVCTFGVSVLGQSQNSCFSIVCSDLADAQRSLNGSRRASTEVVLKFRMGPKETLVPSRVFSGSLEIMFEYVPDNVIWPMFEGGEMAGASGQLHETLGTWLLQDAEHTFPSSRHLS